MPSRALIALLVATVVLTGGIWSGGAHAAEVPSRGVPSSDVRAVDAPRVGVRGADVHGDDERDRYVGTGGLILPGTVDSSTRRQVAACQDCQWRLTSPCVESALGTAFDGQSPCASVVRGCPGGELLRSWFRPSDRPWRQTGLVCLSSRPVTVARLGSAAAQRVPQGIPVLAPGFQPTRGVLAQLPVVFDSGQPGGTREWGLRILGQHVTIRAQPKWTWDFGDGAVLRTSDPGGRYPEAGVSHVFRRAGAYRVSCTTRWTAQFTVGDLGPYPVAEPVSQTVTAIVEVGEGRALLSPPGMAQ